jgi:hypothetical protein
MSGHTDRAGVRPPISTPLEGTAMNTASVPWSKLWKDLALLGFGFLAMIVSLLIDLRASDHSPLAHHTLFARSGAIAVLMCAIVAYWSLAKHYEKFFLYPQRQKILRTSKHQRCVDMATLLLSIAGTLVWAYADLFVGN